MMCCRFLLVLGLAVSATAQPLRLSLTDAVHRALSAGTQAQLARSAEERARIARMQGLQSMLPQADARLIQANQSLNLQTFGLTIPGFPPVVPPFNTTDAQISAATKLFNIAALRAYRSLQQGEAASRYATEQAENDVAGAVARLYVLAQRASTQVASRQADVDLFQRLLKVAQDEFTAGTGTRLDVAQATVQLDRAKQSLLVAQNDFANAVLALLNAVGEDEGTSVTLTEPLAPAAAAPSVDDALRTAQAERPELKEIAAREKAASLALSAQRARKLPSIDLEFTGDYAGLRPSDLLWTRRIAAMASMPLWHADIEAAIANAHAQYNEVRIQSDQQRRDIEQDVRRSVMNLNSANARVEVATENAHVAEEALTVAEDRRQAGYGSPVEVDRAQDQYREAREDLIAAQADAAAASYDLQHATGAIRRLVGGMP